MTVNSAQELASNVNDHLYPSLTRRPWNIFTPADTFWWLVPATEWPAYRYGKLAFSSATDAPRRSLLGLNDEELCVDQLFAGFNVEKGYGKVAIAVNPALKRKTAQIIDPQWLWFEVTGEKGALRFERTLASAAAQAHICVYVVAGFVHDRESGPATQHDAIMYSYADDRLTKRLDNGLPIGALHGARDAATFTRLAESLRSVDEYHWVDLYVGTLVNKGDVDLTDLHQTVLSHFDFWLR